MLFHQEEALWLSAVLLSVPQWVVWLHDAFKYYVSYFLLVLKDLHPRSPLLVSLMNPS